MSQFHEVGCQGPARGQKIRDDHDEPLPFTPRYKLLSFIDPPPECDVLDERLPGADLWRARGHDPQNV